MCNHVDKMTISRLWIVNMINWRTIFVVSLGNQIRKRIESRMLSEIWSAVISTFFSILQKVTIFLYTLTTQVRGQSQSFSTKWYIIIFCMSFIAWVGNSKSSTNTTFQVAHLCWQFRGVFNSVFKSPLKKFHDNIIRLPSNLNCHLRS